MENPFPYNYICIEGNIGAGKTSLSQKIQGDYNCQLILEEFADNPFLPFFYKDPERFSFSVELFFMTERYKQLQKYLINKDIFTSFTVSDYTFTKTLLFARKNLKEEEFRLFTKLYNVLAASFPNPDLIVYLHRDINNLQKNIRKRGRDYELKIKNQYLQKIQNSYIEYYRNILSFPILILDVNDLDFVLDDSHYQKIIRLMQTKYRPGVHQITLAL